MHKKINTRRALLTSVVSMLLCITMLIGSTFAWFTDNATTNVNKIESGTLKIDLVDAEGNSLVGEALSFEKKGDNELWEPGSAWELQDVYVKNNGNLALKYKIVISGINGSAKLNEAIDWTINLGESTFDVDDEFKLAKGAKSDALTIKGTMRTTAGNEYQGLSIDGITITVLATQDTVEFDSYTDQYDAQATYGEVKVVEDKAGLDAAISAAESGKQTAVVLPEGSYTLPSMSNKDVVISGTEDTVVDMSNAVNASGSSVTAQGVTIEYAANSQFKGMQHSDKEVYENCVIKGQQFLYAENVEFINCTFENTGDAYNVWTYGAKNVTFTNCTFNSSGKAVLVYIEGETHANITLNNCKFNATSSYSKAAVEVGESAHSTDTTYNIYINNCTADSNFVANNSTSNLWGNKNSMDKDHLNVVINGTDVY